MREYDARIGRLGAAIAYALCSPFLLMLSIGLAKQAGEVYYIFAIAALFICVHIFAAVIAVLWYYRWRTRVAAMYFPPLMAAVGCALTGMAWDEAIGVWLLASLVLAWHPLLPFLASTNSK